jgi:hypothetical protein
MARPKGGGTLHRLFEVSEQDRRDFVANIERKLQNAPLQVADQGAGQDRPISGIPPLGVPNIGAAETGASNMGVPDTETLKKVPPTVGPAQVSVQRLRIRRALKVQDGHSLGEHLVLTTLWNEGQSVPGKSYRRITIGYRTLSAICGLTVNNCKGNLKSLQAKLAIEAESGYSNTAATTYRVFGFTEILSRREAAGLTHVLRTRGAMFVDPESGVPVSGIPPAAEPGAPDSESGIPERGEKGAPETGSPLRSKKEPQREESSLSSITLVGQRLRQHLSVDDDAVRLIIENCQNTDQDANAEEVAHFAEIVIAKHRTNRKIENWAGFLMAAVPKYFQPPAGELATYRARRNDEIRHGREVAQQILDNPQDSDERTIKWAKDVIRGAPNRASA